MASSSLLAALTVGALALGSPATGPAGAVAVKAGRIHVVEGGRVIENGTILIRDGRIVAVGADLALPPGVRVVDYGPEAVVVPGLVAADSSYGGPRPSQRTADPFLRGADNFDGYDTFTFALQEGITSAYLAPARGRLVAGVGAVVKLAGAPDDPARILREESVIHGSIGQDARNAPGYWEPPVPATSDIGLGVVQRDLPRSLMGAVVAMQELFALAQGTAGAPDPELYGPGTGEELRRLMSSGVPWRVGADTEAEIRALLSLFNQNGQKLVLDGADESGPLAAEIARAGVSVIVSPPFAPNQGGRDLGKEADARWPRYDAPAQLAKAGVRFAIAPPRSGSATDLRFSARLLARGGLDPEAALRAVTLAPAEILGVAERVGSIAPGKDADLAVFGGHPMEGAGVIATWVGGEVAFDVEDLAAAGGEERSRLAPPAQISTVIRVDELHLGDGTVLTPGEVLLQGERIAAVGRSVSRPAGARVVHGAAAMPGMIDALGHLGLEGSRRMPPTRFDLTRIVEPGDAVDRRVALSGVTTVALSPRGSSRTGAPLMAYKPAGEDVERMVVDPLCALRFNWTERNRRESGRALRDRLTKAVEYARKWREYETQLAQWKPPPPEPPADAAEKPKSEDKQEGEAEKKEGEGEKKDAEAEKKPKKKKGEEEPPKPLTGAWEGRVTVPPFQEARIRLYVLEQDGDVRGSLRCSALSDDLIQVSGRRDGHKVELGGLGTRGEVKFAGEGKPGGDAKEQKLKGTLEIGPTKVEVELDQKSTEYVVVRPAERRKPPVEKKEEPKGKPKSPGIDAELEPLRRAMSGQAALIVEVDRKDEILACVEACQQAGIAPVLYGADEAWMVATEIQGRVAGILPRHDVVRATPESGAVVRNRYAELAGAGIPIAFHSAAEEGAAELGLLAAYASARGYSAEAALRALTGDAARMLAIDDRVGRLQPGLDADVLLLDASPLSPAARVVRVWVSGREVRSTP
jgi:imidazolonepropionase-like amidohydrolase